MRKLALALVTIAACVPTPPVVETSQAPPPEVHHADACRKDIADCVAACALREAGRTDFLDFYDRRCAVAMLGQSPARSEPAACQPARPTRETLPTLSRK